MSTKKKLSGLSALLLVMALLLTLTACGSAPSNGETQAQTDAQQTQNTTAETKATDAQQNEVEATEVTETQPSGAKTMVVYFSATGTTKAVAETIASSTGAEIYEITAAEPYTADDLNWHDQNSRTTLEQNDKTVRPAISSETLSLDGYSTIFIGYPIWWGEEPRIMDTFVESYSFDGITMIPFCTSVGSGIGASGANLAANAGSGNWLEGERLSSSSDIEGWISGLGIR